VSWRQRRVVDASVDAALTHWGEQHRRIYTSDPPLRSIAGKLKDLGPRGAGSRPDRPQQSWPEVYRGDGLAVQRVLANVSELPRAAVWAYYVVLRARAKSVSPDGEQITGAHRKSTGSGALSRKAVGSNVKARQVPGALGMSVSDFYRAEVGEEAVSCGLKVLEARRAAAELAAPLR
jgi:hypothetical protein